MAALSLAGDGNCDDDDDDDDDRNDDTDDDKSQLHVLAAHGALEAMRLLLEHGSVGRQLLCAIGKVLCLLLVGKSLVDVVLHDAGHFINLPLNISNTVSVVSKHQKKKPIII